MAKLTLNDVKKIIKTGVFNGKEISKEDRKELKKERRNVLRDFSMYIAGAWLGATGLSLVEMEIFNKSANERINKMYNELKQLDASKNELNISDEEYEERKKELNKLIRKERSSSSLNSFLSSIGNAVLASAIVSPTIDKHINIAEENSNAILEKYGKTSDVVKAFKEKK